MSTDIVGHVIGVVFVAPTIYFVRLRGWDASAWPLFLASLPLYYLLFGVIAMDGGVVLNELLFGLPYIATGLLVWRVRSKATVVFVALAWLSHGFYDYYHDLFFVNPGVFGWYPTFCAVVDIGVGAYLLLSINRLAGLGSFDVTTD